MYGILDKDKKSLWRFIFLTEVFQFLEALNPCKTIVKMLIVVFLTLKMVKMLGIIFLNIKFTSNFDLIC